MVGERTARVSIESNGRPQKTEAAQLMGTLQDTDKRYRKWEGKKQVTACFQAIYVRRYCARLKANSAVGTRRIPVSGGSIYSSLLHLPQVRLSGKSFAQTAIISQEVCRMGRGRRASCRIHQRRPARWSKITS